MAHPTPAAAAPGDAGAPVAAAGPSEAECDDLFDHVIALRAAGDPKITDDDRAKLRAQVRERELARCRVMARATYRCAVAATTLDAFTACDSAEP